MQGAGDVRIPSDLRTAGQIPVATGAIRALRRELGNEVAIGTYVRRVLMTAQKGIMEKRDNREEPPIPPSLLPESDMRQLETGIDSTTQK